MRNPRQACHNNAQRHPVGSTNPWRACIVCSCPLCLVDSCVYNSEHFETFKCTTRQINDDSCHSLTGDQVLCSENMER